MDSLTRSALVLVFLLSGFLSPAFAAYPAKIAPSTHCFTSGSSYNCTGPRFDDPNTAARYACQQINAATHWKEAIVRTLPAAGPHGLTSWSTFSYEFSCQNQNTGEISAGYHSNRVQALPDCAPNAPIANYSPASCVGDPPAPLPVACVNTNGLTITAFHVVPVLIKACYAGCVYNAVNVAVTTYNGVDYSSGSWIGTGEVCSVSEKGLIGGIPGNAQNVGGGGGLSANDLVGLATESTLQQLLSNAQQAATSDNQNIALLQAIKDSTAAIANKPDSQIDTSDPENFEQTYRDGIAATPPDTPGAALEGLATENVDLSGTFNNQQGFLNVAGCPPGPSFTVQGQSYQFDLSPICQFASGISFIVVAMAALTGVKIFIGGFK